MTPAEGNWDLARSESRSQKLPGRNRQFETRSMNGSYCGSAGGWRERTFGRSHSCSHSLQGDRAPSSSPIAPCSMDAIDWTPLLHVVFSVAKWCGTVELPNLDQAIE